MIFKCRVHFTKRGVEFSRLYHKRDRSGSIPGKTRNFANDNIIVLMTPQNCDLIYTIKSQTCASDILTRHSRIP